MKLVISFLLLILFLSTTSSFGQEIVVSSGFYQSEIFTTESLEKGKVRIREAAILNALEKAFGKTIFLGNSMYLSNNKTTQKVESKTIFTTFGESYVKGELVEVLSENFKQITFEKPILNSKKKKIKTEIGFEWLCEVEIKCREYQAPAAQFNSYTLNCSDTNNCETTSFRNGESFFLFFSSPKKGFVTIFLDDNSSSSILLPYRTNRQNYISGFPVEAFKSYVFFENNKSYLDEVKTTIDELEWETRENMEKLSIVFSPKPFEIPQLNQSLIKYVSSQYNLPDNLPSEDFNKWLITLQSKRKDIEIMRIHLTTEER